MKQGTGEYSVRKKRQTRRRRIVTSLACVVVFCTVYALILPAITMEKGACEIPEHTHTRECYSQVLLKKQCRSAMSKRWISTSMTLPAMTAKEG